MIGEEGTIDARRRGLLGDRLGAVLAELEPGGGRWFRPRAARAVEAVGLVELQQRSGPAPQADVPPDVAQRPDDPWEPGRVVLRRLDPEPLFVVHRTIRGRWHRHECPTRAMLAGAPPLTRTTTMTIIEHWIDGDRSSGASSRTSTVWNPATGQPQHDLLLAEPGDVDRAVQAASKAFTTWADSSTSTRTTILFRFRELVSANAERLAGVISDEHGKVLSDARGRCSAGSR